MHVDEGKVNNQTFALTLNRNGYNVGMFGKYLVRLRGTLSCFLSVCGSDSLSRRDSVEQ